MKPLAPGRIQEVLTSRESPMTSRQPKSNFLSFMGTAGSQVEITPGLLAVAAKMTRVRSAQDLGLLRDQLLDYLTFRPYDKSSKPHERSIRWKRTATQILADGYVYDSKGCTDIVIAFIGLCHAQGVKARFVKVRSAQGRTHSLAEVWLEGSWWIVETVARGAEPLQGEITKGRPYKLWHLWDKGIDAWSIGITGPSDIGKVFTTKPIRVAGEN